MRLNRKFLDGLSWAIIIICIMQVIFCLLLQHTNESFAWIIATVGWIAYRIETT